jgi:hypothetical protein
MNNDLLASITLKHSTNNIIFFSFISIQNSYTAKMSVIQIVKKPSICDFKIWKIRNIVNWILN